MPRDTTQNSDDPLAHTTLSMDQMAPHSNAVVMQVAQQEERKEQQKNKNKKRRKEFDMGRYGQRMIALKLNYQG